MWRRGLRDEFLLARPLTPDALLALLYREGGVSPLRQFESLASVASRASVQRRSAIRGSVKRLEAASVVPF